MSEEELFNIDNLSPFKTWNFTSFLLPQPSSGTEAHKNTLALDLDETLIFASTVPIKNADAVITVHVPPTSSSADEPNNSEDHSATVPLPSTPNSYRLYIRYRPFLREFLQYVIQHYEVIIFTASRYYYCGAILKQMEQDFPNLRFMKPGADAVKLNRTAETEKQYVTVLHRNHCTPTNAGYIKDLHLLGRSLKRTVLIDNNAVCGAFQPYNSLLIKDYVGEVDTTSAEAANDTAASLLKEVKGYNANQAPSTEFKDSRSDDTVLKDLIRPGGLMECLSTTDDIPFTLTKTMEYNILIGKSTQIGGPIRKEN
ncbi:nuclear lim interactor-interacting factor-like protein [Angomonas deanei]|uniref:Mitochondrial import inner membrane translocase subunit TIM50 n=1 Tax=Angomonas deanei TaxID=59799 RepID=A0A7G2C9Z3_9TRYP|nr:nuclear lim interactor-interacting factor-like protein [Angomonas deanei]CAD2216680.1 NLI interacting factor-like phosphatase, putative [Angomonas deanei]|eukprot:EPY23563.1 nuclear lim interactor-interacting factor-like protein [Angomonas deanei]